MADIQQGMGGTGEKKINTGPNWQKILTPILGFVLVALGGIVGALLSPRITRILHDNIKSFPQAESMQPQMQVVVGFGIFIILLLVMYVVYAMIAPKPVATTNEAELDKEKKEKILEQARTKKRNIEMKQRMKQASRIKKE
jgi:short subunit fatty acids transporter